MARKILIIDDDIDLVEVLRIVLEGENFEVLDAQNGERGMRMIHKEKPDLIILDVMMDTEDEGFHVANKLKADEHTCKIPIVMLTAVSQMTGYRYGKDTDSLPVEEYLEKPVMPNKIVEVIRKYIS